MKRPTSTFRRPPAGVSLIETMVSVGVFGLVLSMVFIVMYKGFTAVSMANARQDAENSLNKSYFWLKRDLEMASANFLGHKRVSLPGGGDAIWFLSAVETGNDDPASNFIRQAENGAPLWQRHILYYVARPSDYPAVSGGLQADIDPDPEADFYAPHKFLIRKVIDRAGDPETLMTPSEIDQYITAPVDYGLSTFATETDVLDYKLVADKLLGMRVDNIGATVEIELSAFRMAEAGKSLAVGKVSLRDHPARLARLARFVLRN